MFKRIKPSGCKCSRKVVSMICGCVNPECEFDEWECAVCGVKKRYKSWILFHYQNNHK